MDKEQIIAKYFAKEVLPLFVGLRNELKNVLDVLKLANERKLPEVFKTEITNFPVVDGVQDVKIINQIKEIEITNPVKKVEVEGLDSLTEKIINEISTHGKVLPETIKELQRELLGGLDKLAGTILRVQVQNPPSEVKFPDTQKVIVLNPTKEVGVVRISNSEPSQAIPVILTDKRGQKFYEVLSQAVGGLSDIDLNPIKKLLTDINTNIQDIEINADEINIDLDDVEALLATTNSLLTAIGGYVDGVEGLLNTLITDFNAEDFAQEATLQSVLSALNDIKTYTDGIEGLLTTLNAKDFATQTTLASVLSELTAIKGFVDGLEGFVDGIEGLLTTSNSILSTLLTEAEFEARVGEVQETPTLYTVLGRLKSIEDNLDALVSGVVWQREVANGNGFELSSNLIAISGTSEVAFVLIKNPSSTKSMRIRLMSFVRSSTSAEPAIFRIYRNPTITTNGTALTINNIKSGGASSAMTAFHTPTISANGTLLYGGGYTNALVPIDFDLGFLVAPLENILITIKPDTTNKDHLMSANWLELVL